MLLIRRVIYPGLKDLHNLSLNGLYLNGTDTERGSMYLDVVWVKRDLDDYIIVTRFNFNFIIFVLFHRIRFRLIALY